MVVRMLPNGMIIRDFGHKGIWIALGKGDVASEVGGLRGFAGIIY